MLIGAHVSPAGGPANAVARGVERGCDAIQIFNQNPRAWKPTVYSDEQVADFHEAMEKSRVDALLIHAVYLLNAATTDKDMRNKTRASLIASLQAGDALGAHAVVLHPGSALAGKVAPVDQARRQAHRPGAGRERELRAAPREHRRAPAGRSGAHSRSSLTSSTPPAAPSAWACAWTPATCSPRATTSAPSKGSRRRSTSATRRWEPRSSARCTSTTPRRRWAPTAIGTPTSGRASSAGTAAPSSSPSRASTDCPACWRHRDRTGTARRGSRSPWTRRLRSQGTRRRR